MDPQCQRQSMDTLTTLIIDGLYHTIYICAQNMMPILMLNCVLQLTASSMYTNMCTRVMIGPQCQLNKTTRYSPSLIQDMYLLLRLAGAYSLSVCIRNSHHISVSPFILKVRTLYISMKTMTSTMCWNVRQYRTLLLQVGSK